MSESELAAVLELCLLPGIGNGQRLRELLQRYGSAEAALHAPAAEVGEEAVRVRGSVRIAGRVRASMAALRRLDVQVLHETDPRYPARLMHLEDPPPFLFARGRLELLERPAVAVVGSRDCTEYGESVARWLTAGLANAGVVVVSGLARGIDTSAHLATLALGGGTIAVLASGIDVPYPRRNAALYERIAREGLLLSETPPGTPALPYLFPRRNRLIAALALGVLVVEAAEESGALSTARHAADLGREVMAVPGPIGRRTNSGTNRLLRDGATMVLEVRDILDAVGLGALARAAARSGAARGRTDAADEPPAGLSPTGVRVWRALGTEPVHVDELADACGVAAGTLLSTLLELELAGHVRQAPGSRYARA